MAAKTKIPKKKKEINYPFSKKELNELKEAYKKGKLHFNSKEIARAMLMDEGVRRGLTK